MSSFLAARLSPRLQRILKFCVTGGIGATIDLGSLRIMVHFFGVPPQIGVVISSLFSVIFVYISNKFFTFNDRASPYHTQIVKFALVYGFAIALNALMSNFFLWLGVQYLIAKCLAIGIGAVINYILSTTFIFKMDVPPVV